MFDDSLWAPSPAVVIGSLPPIRPSILVTARHLLALKYFMVASFTLLVLEHCDTLGREVDRIWLQPRSLASLLFSFNRYMTLIQFIITLLAFNQGWSEEICGSWFRFSPALCVLSIASAESILVLRDLASTYALYNRNKLVLLGLLCTLVIQIGLMSYCVVIANYLRLPLPLKGCIAVGRVYTGISFYIAPFITDTVIFILTVLKTAQYIRVDVRTPLARIVLRDGCLYFLLVGLVNLMNVIIFAISPMDLKAVGSSFSQVVTTILISRLQLNLLGENIEYYRDRGIRTAQPTSIRTGNITLEPRQTVLPAIPAEPVPTRTSSSFTWLLNAPAVGGMTGAAMTAFSSNMHPPILPPVAYGSNGRMPSASSPAFNSREPSNKVDYEVVEGQVEQHLVNGHWSKINASQPLDASEYNGTSRAGNDHQGIVSYRKRKGALSTWSAALSNRPAVEII